MDASVAFDDREHAGVERTWKESHEITRRMKRKHSQRKKARENLQKVLHDLRYRNSGASTTQSKKHIDLPAYREGHSCCKFSCCTPHHQASVARSRKEAARVQRAYDVGHAQFLRSVSSRSARYVAYLLTFQT